MLQLRLFVERENLIDNTHMVVSPVGELSTRSKTYAKDIQRFTGVSGTDHILNVFDMQRGEDKITAISEDNLTLVRTLVKSIFDQVEEGVTSDSGDSLATELKVRFDMVTQVEVFEMTNYEGKWYPSQVNIMFFNGVEDIYLKIWLSDDWFRKTYDGYNIVVITPVDNVDLLLNSNTSVKELATTVRLRDSLDRLNTRVKDHPYTKLISIDFTVENPNWDEKDYVSFTWLIALYGLAGDNDDSIYKAITDYILSNSEQSEDVWSETLPGVFKRIEFTIVPMWNQYSVPNKTLEAGIHSPIVPYKKMLPTAISHMPGYEEAHIGRYLQTTTFLHKSIALLLCSNQFNRDNQWDIRNIYPDFAVISSTHYDFARLDLKTREFILLLGTMLNVAETITSSSLLPAGLSRVIRDDKIYVVANVNEVLYYVLAKQSYVEV